MVPGAAIDVVDVRLDDRRPGEGAPGGSGDDMQRRPDFAGDGAHAVDERCAVGAVRHQVVVVVGIDTVRHAVRVGIQKSLIDGGIAVVVQPVAELRRPGMDRRHRVVAVAAAGGEAVSIGVEILVDRPVAVVVDPVAGLRRRQARRARLARSAHAVLHRPRTSPHPARRCPETLVHLPVAVIVDPVAGLRRRCPGRANLQHPPDAGRHRPRARPHATARRPETLVHLPVAVVVDPVAGLRRRRPRRAGLQHPADAGRHRPHARPHPARRRTKLFVHLPVAVIVDPVADLRRRRSRRARLAHAPHAVLHRPRARPHTARRRSEPLVHLPVAVVVQPVAHLGMGTDAADAGPPGTAHAGFGPEFARPDVGAARSGGSIQTVAAGLRVIGNAVAVVILPVADARRSRIDGRIGVVAVGIA